jgi:hypothetical protein
VLRDLLILLRFFDFEEPLVRAGPYGYPRTIARIVHHATDESAAPLDPLTIRFRLSPPLGLNGIGAAGRNDAPVAMDVHACYPSAAPVASRMHRDIEAVALDAFVLRHLPSLLWLSGGHGWFPAARGASTHR